jgi:hypothetical protein
MNRRSLRGAFTLPSFDLAVVRHKVPGRRETGQILILAARGSYLQEPPAFNRIERHDPAASCLGEPLAALDAAVEAGREAPGTVSNAVRRCSQLCACMRVR